jgi:hypothetical protein
VSSFYIEDGVKYFNDGREVCIIASAAGKRKYNSRKMEMRDRQNELCCLCGQWMREDDTSFEHQFGRGAGRQDDRIVLPDRTRINGASHYRCNGARGSKRTPFLLQ